MVILLLGNGGREHALALKIAESPFCTKLFVAPGNAGTAMCGENVALDINDHGQLSEFVLRHGIDMVVAGPEEPLVRGLGDHFATSDNLGEVMFVGPPRAGAMLEGSKAFAKAFMERHQIPTAAYRSFTCDSLKEGIGFIRESAAPYVLKADGLAAGKGVVICNSCEEAEETLREMLCNELFGEASRTVVIEEYLIGRELSVFAITDGSTFRLLPSAKDYKRVGEGDTGANTGGMGAVSPVPFAGTELMERIRRRIVMPTIDGLKQEGIPYCGFLFFGLMEVDGDPYVIEYNARLGDPEAQVIIPRLKSDLVELMQACCSGRLHEHSVEVSPMHAVAVVLASGGYPGEYEKGFPINQLSLVSDSRLFFAGVQQTGSQRLTSGGRVMAVTSLSATLENAIASCYKNASVIDFKGKYYRRDIGKDLLEDPGKPA